MQMHRATQPCHHVAYILYTICPYLSRAFRNFLQKDDGNSEKANFWEATGGRAILTLSGIDKFLKQ